MAGKSLVTALAAFSSGFLVIGCTGSSWQPVAMSMDQCVQHAKLAMRDADFTERFAIAETADGMVVSGRHGGYWAQLHCIGDKRTVTLEITGFDPAQTERYKKSIIKRF